MGLLNGYVIYIWIELEKLEGSYYFFFLVYNGLQWVTRHDMKT